MCCPFHDDRNPSAGFYTDTELFYCFACDLALPPDRFYMRLKEVSLEEARRVTGRIWGDKQRVEPDPLTIARLRNEGEALLQLLRGLDRKAHATLAEQLDKLLFKFERGEWGPESLGKEYQGWKTRVSSQSTESREHRSSN